MPVGLNESFSGFQNIGHNSFIDLVVLWIIPKYVVQISDASLC